MNNLDEEEYSFFPAPCVLEKYNKLFLYGWFFLALGLSIMAASFLYNQSIGVYDVEYKSFAQIIPFILVFIPGYGVSLLVCAFKERGAFYKADMNGIMFDERGISGPIAFLEGPTRDYIRDRKKDIFFSVAWPYIENFIVEPRRGKRGDAPPYYKVTLKGTSGTKANSYFILREYFLDKEDEILNAVRKYLDEEQIVINDQAVKESE